MFNWIKTKLKNGWKWLLGALGVGVIIATTFVGSPSQTEYCYATYENEMGKELVIEMDCEDYHWLGTGPGNRQPKSPEGYIWKKASSHLEPISEVTIEGGGIPSKSFAKPIRTILPQPK